MVYVVGLTGGIGSGKSVAAAEFARLGAAVIDTDAIAHELTGPGGAAIDAIKREFGADFIDSASALDRGRMREAVFTDPTRRKQLEAILHPMIRTESQRRIAVVDAKKSAPYVVHVVPLLIESPDYRARVSRVLVVDSPESLQVSRVRQRSGQSEEEVRRILASQIQRETRRAAADDVIDNSGTIDALQHEVRRLHEKYLRMAAAAG